MCRKVRIQRFCTDCSPDSPLIMEWSDPVHCFKFRWTLFVHKEERECMWLTTNIKPVRRPVVRPLKIIFSFSFLFLIPPSSLGLVITLG